MVAPPITPIFGQRFFNRNVDKTREPGIQPRGREKRFLITPENVTPEKVSNVSQYEIERFLQITPRKDAASTEKTSSVSSPTPPKVRRLDLMSSIFNGKPTGDSNVNFGKSFLPRTTTMSSSSSNADTMEQSRSTIPSVLELSQMDNYLAPTSKAGSVMTNFFSSFGARDGRFNLGEEIVRSNNVSKEKNVSATRKDSTMDITQNASEADDDFRQDFSFSFGNRGGFASASKESVFSFGNAPSTSYFRTRNNGDDDAEESNETDHMNFGGFGSSFSGGFFWRPNFQLRQNLFWSLISRSFHFVF